MKPVEVQATRLESPNSNKLGQDRRRQLLNGVPVLAGFSGLTAVFLWPLLRHFPTRVFSQGGDGSTFLWSYWFMPQRLARFENPFVTTHLFHPVGANLAFQTTTPLEMVLSWPIAQLFGVGIAANLLQILAVLLSAVGAYLLALQVCNDRRAAFFAGAAFAFVPYRFVHMGGHFNLIHTEFLPFGLLALLRLLDQPSMRRAVVLGVVVGLTFLTDFYYAVFLLLAIGVVLLVLRHDGSTTRRIAPRLAQASVVAGLVASPIIVATIAALLAGELDPLPGLGGADIYSADLLSWVVPPERHPWWGRTFSLTEEGVAYPGLVVLGLALGGHRLGVAAVRKAWVVLTFVAGTLALGPFLHVARRSGSLFSYLGNQFSVPLPYLALHLVPVVSGIRVPGRFAIVAILSLDVLAAVTLSRIARRRPRWAWPVFLGALAITLIEFLPGPLANHPIDVPAPYHAIRKDPGPGAVLEIPLQWEVGVDVLGDAERSNTIFVYYATVHGKPLVSGSISRFTRERLTRLKAISVYRQVLAMEGEPGFHDTPKFDSGDLRDLGIGFVVYHRDRPQPRVLAHLQSLDLDVLADDGTIVVWRVSPL